MVLGSIAMITLLLINPGRLAAQNENKADKEKQRMEKLKTDLGLTDDQVKKVQDIETDSKTKMKALRESNKDGDMEAIRPQMQAIKKDKEDKLSAVLTKDQMAKYKEMNGKGMGHGRGDGSGGGRGGN